LLVCGLINLILLLITCAAWKTSCISSSQPHALDRNIAFAFILSLRITPYKNLKRKRMCLSLPPFLSIHFHRLLSSFLFLSQSLLGLFIARLLFFLGLHRLWLSVNALLLPKFLATSPLTMRNAQAPYVHLASVSKLWALDSLSRLPRLSQDQQLVTRISATSFLS
jgi:hypothetical protein